MAKLVGAFTGSKIVNFKNKKTQEDEHFRKANFIEKGGTGKPYEIFVSDDFQFEEMQPVEIEVLIEQRGFNIDITLKED